MQEKGGEGDWNERGGLKKGVGEWERRIGNREKRKRGRY